MRPKPETTSDKHARLRALARHRAASTPTGYKGIGEYHDGAYECEHVSPYTKSAANVDARVMLILQDWCSHEYLNGPLRPKLVELGYDPGVRTNDRLAGLLREHLDLDLASTYVTNLFASLSAPIAPSGAILAVPGSAGFDPADPR